MLWAALYVLIVRHTFQVSGSVPVLRPPLVVSNIIILTISDAAKLYTPHLAKQH
jgi:hypothetical protein